VGPPTGHTGGGTSLPSLFPNINKVLLLEIGQNSIWGIFSKLDTWNMDKPIKLLDCKNSTMVHKE